MTGSAGPGTITPAGRLGRAVRARREELGYVSRQELGAASGLSVTHLNRIENGTAKAMRPSTVTALERVLRWPPGTVQMVLAGGSAPSDVDAVGPGVSVLDLIVRYQRRRAELEAELALEVSGWVWTLTNPDHPRNGTKASK